MPPATQTAPASKKKLWAGRIISAIAALMLLLSGAMKLVKPPSVLQGFAHFGYPESLIAGIGILEIVCTVVYLIPLTSVIGAILVTGYLGGATASNVRVSDPSSIATVILGVLVWAGLYLRDDRLRALLPFRTPPSVEFGQFGDIVTEKSGGPREVNATEKAEVSAFNKLVN